MKPNSSAMHASANITKVVGAKTGVSAGCLSYFCYPEFYPRNKKLFETKNGAERKQEVVYNFE